MLRALARRFDLPPVVPDVGVVADRRALVREAMTYFPDALLRDLPEEGSGVLAVLLEPAATLVARWRR